LTLETFPVYGENAARLPPNRGDPETLNDVIFLVVNMFFGCFFAKFWGAHLVPRGVARRFIVI
jgi:hypothetical protein